MKRVPPKPQPASIGPDGEPLTGNEDTECAICDDGECENSNAIVFCDGCNLAVHQDCYGIPYIPEGQWLCRKCTVSPDRAVSCVLCPNEGGAFKQTTNGKWAHLLCAMWIPETGVSNPVYMEPIDSIERIPRARWKLQCYLCGSRHGACIQCDNKACFTAFHVTCARRAGLLIKAQRQRALPHHNQIDSEDEDEDDGHETLKAMCHKHLPKHLRQQVGSNAPVQANGVGADADEDDTSTRASTPVLPTVKPTSRKITIRRGANGSISAVVAPANTLKSARAYKKSYRAGPPLVPAFIVNRVLEYVGKIQLRKKHALVVLVAKFWSLKREARRGAPLLKRLHLEPWTASTAPQEVSEADRLKKLQFMLLLREDLERLRMLAELVRKREREKLRATDQIRQSLVLGALFPFHHELRSALDQITALDRNNFFLSPVSRSEVPDYYEIIKEPMEWATISAKLDEHQYHTVKDFAHDVNLVLNNAMLYNKQETSFHRNALKIKIAAAPILESLQRLPSQHAQEILDAGGPEFERDANAASLHLEPPLELLACLEDYDDEKMLRTIKPSDPLTTAPSNVVEDLMRQYHHLAKTDEQVQLEREKENKRLERETAAQEAKKKRQEAAASARENALKPHDPTDGDETTLSTPARRMTRSTATTGQRDKNGLSRHRDDGRAGAGRGDFDLEVSPGHLEAKDTFLRFENGWILPEGSRRHGRVRQSSPSRAPSSSARSRSKSSPTKSGAGTLVSRKSGHDSALPSAGLGIRDKSADSSDLSDVDESVGALSPNLSERGPNHVGTPTLKRRRPAMSDDVGPDRQKQSRISDDAEQTNSYIKAVAPRRSGRQSQTVVPDTAGELSPPSNEGPEVDETSDHSTAVKLARIQAEKKRRTAKREAAASRVKKPTVSKPDQSMAGCGKPSDFGEGTIVWGKLGGHPFFPSEIMPEDEEIVPAAVLDAKDDQTPQEGEQLHLLRFYDPSRSYGWVSTRSLRFLFEDDALDERMLNAAKSSSQRAGLRKAMKMAQMAVQGTLEE